MPSLDKRKDSPSAQKRFEKEYIHIDKQSHPYRLFPPKKTDTDALRELMKSRNYIRIMTRIDKNCFITMQYYIYAEPDIWMAGDSLTFNQNPDKKIWCEYMCSARKDKCLCNSEEIHEFLTVCPNCKSIVLMMKTTPFECKHCHYKISHSRVNDMPIMNAPCEWCPAEIGWDEVQKIKELLFSKLVPRAHIVAKDIERKQKELMDDITERIVEEEKNKGVD